MKWPWVSRADADGRIVQMQTLLATVEAARLDAKDQNANALSLLQTQVDIHYAARVAADARFDALLEKYHALRVSGANAPEHFPRAEKAEPDPVTQAIIARAGRSAVLRKHYSDYVREQRAAGVDDADIAKAILEGQQLNPEDGEAG